MPAAALSPPAALPGDMEACIHEVIGQTRRVATVTVTVAARMHPWRANRAAKRAHTPSQCNRCRRKGAHLWHGLRDESVQRRHPAGKRHGLGQLRGYLHVGGAPEGFANQLQQLCDLHRRTVRRQQRLRAAKAAGLPRLGDKKCPYYRGTMHRPAVRCQHRLHARWQHNRLSRQNHLCSWSMQERDFSCMRGAQCK